MKNGPHFQIGVTMGLLNFIVKTYFLFICSTQIKTNCKRWIKLVKLIIYQFTFVCAHKILKTQPPQAWFSYDTAKIIKEYSDLVPILFFKILMTILLSQSFQHLLS